MTLLLVVACTLATFEPLSPKSISIVVFSIEINLFWVNYKFNVCEEITVKPILWAICFFFPKYGHYRNPFSYEICYQLLFTVP